MVKEPRSLLQLPHGAALNIHDRRHHHATLLFSLPVIQEPGVANGSHHRRRACTATRQIQSLSKAPTSHTHTHTKKRHSHRQPLEGPESTICTFAWDSPVEILCSKVLCSLRKLLRHACSPLAATCLGAILSREHVEDDMVLRWADSTRFLGGERGTESEGGFSGAEVLKVRLELGVWIPCGWGAAEGSVWKRDFRGCGWRGGRDVKRVESGGEGVVCCVLLLLVGLRMLENQLWTAVAGDPSSSGEGWAKVSDLLRVCLAVLDSISSLIPTPVLYLLHSHYYHQCQYIPFSSLLFHVIDHKHYSWMKHLRVSLVGFCLNTVITFVQT